MSPRPEVAERAREWLAASGTDTAGMTNGEVCELAERYHDGGLEGFELGLSWGSAR